MEPKPIDTKQWQKRDRDVKIDKFVATAVKMPGVFDPENMNRQLIHWRGGAVYTQANSQRSTSFDTRKESDTDPLIEVQLISKAFAVSSSAPYYWETTVIKEYTTTDVYNLLIENNFNKYRYNGKGSGCLTWTTQLISLLESKGVLPAGSKKKFLAKVEEVRKDDMYWVPEEHGAEFF